MKEVKHNGNKFLIYDSIQELPAERFFKFNLHTAIESGIGSDLESVSARSAELRNWIQQDKKEEAMNALDNYDGALRFLISNISPGTMAFACLVYSCNGKRVDDLSDEGLKRNVISWGKKGLTIGKIWAWVDDAKKKFDHEQEVFFPKIYNSGQVVEMAGQIKRRAIASLQIMQGKAVERNQKVLESIDKILMEIIAPKRYGGSEGFEVSRIHNFEQSVGMIKEVLRVDADKMTAFQFIQNCQRLKEKYKAQKIR